jgi:hypothetical protein
LTARRQNLSLRVSFRPGLRASRGKLAPAGGPGVEVHAGSFLRKREIVLDAGLLASPRELARILIHELFHFVWLRLGNPGRRSYEALIAREIRERIPGELGWSAEWRKRRLTARDRSERTRRWREYVCESFCDTAGWLLGGGGRHEEFTLDRRCRTRRRRWFCGAEALQRIAL